MSDKKMLNETTIRKMMKLANIPALSEKFIQENYYDYPSVAEQEDAAEVEDEVVLDAPVDDVEVDAEVEIEEPELGVDAAEDLVKDLMGVIEDHFPEVEINVDGGEEEVEVDDELELEEPVADDVPVLDDEELEVDAEVEEEPVLEAELDEAGAGEAGYEDEGAAYAEITADKQSGYGGLEEDEVVEEEEDSAHNQLIDAIAAKVAERLLAEAKKTNK